MTKQPAATLLLALALGVAAAAQQAHAPVKKTTRLAPHPQENLPPLDLPAYQLPRPNDVIRHTYKYAAEHPEVLSYMPCFCGCEMGGHKSNEDCFVMSRGKNGDVTAWTEHGMVCAMCLAVAERAEAMCSKGATPAEARADIIKRYGQLTGTMTPTPEPPTATSAPKPALKK